MHSNSMTSTLTPEALSSWNRCTGARFEVVPKYFRSTRSSLRSKSVGRLSAARLQIQTRSGWRSASSAGIKDEFSAARTATG
jgi:hypothetical protein